MKAQGIMPPTYVLISIIVMIALHFLLPGTIVVQPLWNLVGVIPLALGVILNLSADQTFHRVGTTVRPFEESSALVTRGVFQISRNPMYLGFVLILIGIAVLLGSLTSYAVVLAFVVLIQKRYVTVEERILAEKFGAQWEAYKRSTRRWL